jgi:hypothetical protein
MKPCDRAVNSIDGEVKQKVPELVRPLNVPSFGPVDRGKDMQNDAAPKGN